MRITTGHRDKENLDIEELEEQRADDKVRRKYEDRLGEHF